MNKRFTLLVVDDDAVNVQFIASALKAEYDVLTAENGHDAMDQLKEHKVHLLLLDVMMPDLSGFDLCTIIKSAAAYADIPVIFLTALETGAGEEQGLEAGAIDYLAKPINLNLLKLRVRNHLALQERNDLVLAQRDLLARQKEDLESALARVKQLEGIIPICMYCKKIRDDQECWHQLEEYLCEHSEASFSHGICPHCMAQQMKLIGK
jgi:DNA-binding response OmpR family regulator